ncbi:MAG: aldehyde ferredoxin oxidoreductase C-terminal domain-containing protein [Elusimicrobiales bacterium]
MKGLILMAGLAAALPAAAQEGGAGQPAANSFRERGPSVTYAVETIPVEGEVESPGPVELAALPLRDAAVKEPVWFDKANADTDGPQKGVVLECDKYDSLLQHYYDQRGYDKRGIPTMETLRKLGLEAEAAAAAKVASLN